MGDFNRPKRSLYDHKAPVLPPRELRRLSRLSFVLMHDKKGWQCLPNPGFSTNTSDYLRVPPTTTHDDVDVDKGTLVEVDPQSDFDPSNNISVIVVSVDRPEIKISLLMKELMVIEEEAFNRLLPLKPSERYKLLTDKEIYPILSASIGDTVWFDDGIKMSVGMIQYIGPVEGMGQGHWFGVELLDSQAGQSDGVFGHRRYFSAPPCSSVFVSMAKLTPYDEQMNSLYDKPYHTYLSGHEEVTHPSTLRIVQGLGNRSDSSNRQHTRNDEIHEYAGLERNNKSTKNTTSEGNAMEKTGRNLEIDDRVVWLSDHGPELGTVRWLGYIDGRRGPVAGVEFDHPVGSGDGIYKDQRLFQTKRNHASLVPLEGLIREEDFETHGSNLNPTTESHGVMEHIFAGLQSASLLRHSSSVESSKHSDKRYLTPTEENMLNENAQKNLSEKSGAAGYAGSSSPPPTPPPRRSMSYGRKCPMFDKLSDKFAIKNAQDIDLGSLVELQLEKQPFYGVVRWIGWLYDEDAKGVGVELEDEMPGATNGWHQGTQLFACPERKAVFVPLGHFKLDHRFDDECNNNSSTGLSDYDTFGKVECPVVPGFYPPIEMVDVEKLYGRNKGIQGHKNSCYLDATLFAMFAFTSVFDSILYRPPSGKDISEYKEVQKVLREEIVNPLRKNLFVRADRVMKLRKFLDHLTSVRGLLSEEKDPEEFLNSLLTQTLKAAPFLELSSGQTSHLYQLFVERDKALRLPTVQELFEQSFLTSNVKLKKVPSVLILQLPRFGKQFKVYDRILPSQYLDITDIIEDSPRQCIICGKLATLECLECFKEHGAGLDSTAFCEICFTTVHNHHKRRKHKPKELNVPSEFLERRNSSETIPRSYMELAAVLCIETSHYVTFVKCGIGPDASWCFFDSMADRRGESNGYNIPEVSSAHDVPRWFTEEGAAFLNSCKDDKMLPVQAKRFICDGYMCFYQSPEVMQYQ